MNRLLTCLAAIAAATLFGATLLVAQDAVVVSNGDRIHGEVKELRHARLKFDTDAADNIFIEWQKVLSLEAVGPFEIELVTGAKYFGSIEPAADSGRVQIVEFNRSVEVDLYSIVTLVPIEAAFLERLDGNIEFGLDFAKANKNLNVTGRAGVSYRGRSVFHSLDASTFVQSRQDVETTRRLTVNAQSQRYLGDRWLAGAVGGLERNDELELDLRTTLGLFGGRVLRRTNELDWYAGAGVNWNLERFAGESSFSTTWELPIATGLDLFLFGDNETYLRGRFALLPSLSDFGRIRTELDLSFRRDLFGDFYVALSGYNSSDSRPPTDASGSDYGISFSIGYDL